MIRMEKDDYENLVDMFAHPGWRFFTEFLTELEDVITKSAVDNAISNDQWQYCRGQTHQLRSILGYENYVNLAWDESQREDSDVDPL